MPLSMEEANVNGIDDNTCAETEPLAAATAFQLQVGVRQRVFDVPHRVAAGGKSCSCHIGKSCQLD